LAAVTVTEFKYDAAQRGALADYVRTLSEDRFRRFYAEVVEGLGSVLVIDHVEDAGPGGSPDEYCACGNNGLRWLFLTRPREGRLEAHVRPGKAPGWCCVGEADVCERAIKAGLVQIGSTCIQTVLGISEGLARQLIRIGQEVQEEAAAVAKQLATYGGSFDEYLRARPVEAWLAVLEARTPAPFVAREARKLLAARLPLPGRLERTVRRMYEAEAERQGGVLLMYRKQHAFLVAYDEAGLRSKTLTDMRSWLEAGRTLTSGQERVLDWAMEALPTEQVRGLAEEIAEQEVVLDLCLELGIGPKSPVGQTIMHGRRRLRGHARDSEDDFQWFQRPLLDWQLERLFGALAANGARVAELDAEGDPRLARARDYWISTHPEDGA
jgi:hypothetical protein